MTVDSIVSDVHRLLIDNLPVRSVSKTTSGWITFNCPMCGDKRKRAGIIISGPKISYNCFNCSYRTGWAPNPHLGKKYKDLASKLGATETTLHAVQVELLKHSEELDIADTTDYVYNLTKFDTVELPEHTMLVDDLEEDHPVKQYAKYRGLLGLTSLLYFDEPLYKQRLVVPFMYNNELVGWSARHIAPPDKRTPKYLNKMQPGYVYNIDKFANEEREIVIVVEGVFDAVAIDGVSILGNHVTAEQAALIDKLGKRVIVCPDRDKAGKQLIEEALALDWEVSFPPWSKDIKDASDAVQKYGRLLTVASIIKHATNNKIKAEVKMRML